MIADPALNDRLSHVPVPLIIVDGSHGPIDRNLMEVGSTQARELRVRVGEETALQQGIIREIDAGDEMTWMEGYLFRFGKKAIGVAI